MIYFLIITYIVIPVKIRIRIPVFAGMTIVCLFIVSCMLNVNYAIMTVEFSTTLVGFARLGYLTYARSGFFYGKYIHKYGSTSTLDNIPTICYYLSPNKKLIK